MRTPHLSAHAGQIAFPGGKIDPTDASPTAAALREAEEEIGLDRALVEPVGTSTPTSPAPATASSRSWPGRPGPPPDAQPARGGGRLRGAAVLPDDARTTTAAAAASFGGATRYFYEMPFGERYIWGVTAGIIRGLYERVFG